MNGFRFHSPYWLLLLPLAVWAVWRAYSPALAGAVLYSNVGVLRGLPVTLMQRLKRLIPWVCGAALALLIVALARPQMGKSESRVSTEGIAIEIVIDCSGSMEAMDFRIKDEASSRINAVKYVAKAFINGSDDGKLKGRPNDLIGLVRFGGYADSVCPLTLDHGALTEIVNTLSVPKPIYDRSGRPINGDEMQTAIGDGVTAGLDRLKAVTAKSKILILMTDGANDFGMIDPRDAAKVAETLGIKLYTICVGTNDAVPFPVKDAFGQTQLIPQRFPIDEELLKDMAATGHGKYYHAYGTDALEDVYAEIDKLEKSKVEETKYTEFTEYYVWLTWSGLGLLLGVFGLNATRMRTLP